MVRRSLFMKKLFVICALVLASVSSAETLLTEQQAVKIALPKSGSVQAESKSLSVAQKEDMEHRTHLKFPENEYKWFVGSSNGNLDGYAVVLNELGKHELITFIVGISPKGEVTDVVVMEYRESRGKEVREKRFLSQFYGKKRTDPIQVNRDIVNYTGATLSSHAIARGVKRALLLVELFYPPGATH